MTFLSLGLAGAATAGGINAATAQTADLVGQFALIGGFFAYSRSQEREADQFGVQLLADAAYDAAEASAIWRNMLDEEAAATQQGDKPFFFFATHPQSESRMDGLAEYADQLQAAGGATVETNREAYQQHVYPQLGVMLADELDLHQSGRTEFLLRGLLADGVAPGLLNYSLGELYRIRNGAGDRELALQQYETALQFDDVPPDAFRSLGLLYLKDRRHELANSQFRNYLDASPEAPDREMIEYYMTMGGTPQ
jgi:predicted Zn-dependent protease